MLKKSVSIFSTPNCKIIFCLSTFLLAKLAQSFLNNSYYYSVNLLLHDSVLCIMQHCSEFYNKTIMKLIYYLLLLTKLNESKSQIISPNRNVLNGTLYYTKEPRGALLKPAMRP